MRVTVMGLGLFGGGIGAAGYFAQRGHQVIATDLRDRKVLAPALAQLEGLDIEFVLGQHTEKIFTDADLVVVNPGVRPDNRFLEIARSAGSELTTEINLVFKQAGSPIVGVTGSNGKSTVAAMIASALEAAGRKVLLGGNLGGSLLGAVEDFGTGGIIVLELSSFQLQRLAWEKRSPHMAVCTNITPNHLDWHDTFEDYARAKENITRFQGPDDFLVLGVDCPLLGKWPDFSRAQVARYALEGAPPLPAAWIEGTDLLVNLQGRPEVLLSANALKVPGRHNLSNALAAGLCCLLLEVSPEKVGAGLEAFKGLEHRLQFVGRAAGADFYNDSIATTPEATIAALESFDLPIVLMAGGSGKGLDFSELGRVVARRARTVVLSGETGSQIRAAIEAAVKPDNSLANSPELLEASDFDQAFKIACRKVPAGGAMLLSPASASFNEFANFADRGRRFCQLLGQLQK
jgi:UDP-N-acetylmuramoylalanine--D-glutamate ligase